MDHIRKNLFTILLLVFAFAANAQGYDPYYNNINPMNLNVGAGTLYNPGAGAPCNMMSMSPYSGGYGIGMGAGLQYQQSCYGAPPTFLPNQQAYNPSFGLTMMGAFAPALSGVLKKSFDKEKSWRISKSDYKLRGRRGSRGSGYSDWDDGSIPDADIDVTTGPAGRKQCASTEVQSEDGKTCVPRTCSGKDVLSEDRTKCEPCPGDQINIGGSCKLPACKDQMAPNAAGDKCITCEGTTEYFENQCLEKCKGEQVRTTAGVCELKECKAGAMPNPEKDKCIPIACVEGTMPNETNNACIPLECKPGTMPNETKNGCVEISCSPETMPNESNNACIPLKCGPRAIPNDARNGCQECEGDVQVINGIKTCKIKCDVGPGIFIDLVNGKQECRTCKPNEIVSDAATNVSQSGKICHPCGAKKEPNTERNKCIDKVNKKCSADEIKIKDEEGFTISCKKCGQGEEPSRNRLSCSKICNDNQIQIKEGNVVVRCETCEIGKQIPDEEKKQCIDIPCTKKYGKEKINGKCYDLCQEGYEREKTGDMQCKPICREGHCGDDDGEDDVDDVDVDPGQVITLPGDLDEILEPKTSACGGKVVKEAQSSDAVKGAMRIMATFYQDCDPIDKILDNNYNAPKKLNVPAELQSNGAYKRTMSSQTKEDYIKYHPYIQLVEANKKLKGTSPQCRDIKKMPPMFSFGGKSHLTRKLTDIFKDQSAKPTCHSSGVACNSVSVTSMDCSSFIQNSLVSQGLRIYPDGRYSGRRNDDTQTNLGEDVNTSMFNSIAGNKSSCLEVAEFKGRDSENSIETIKSGDVVSLSAQHTFMIGSVGKDPLGINRVLEHGTKESDCEKINRDVFDFTVFQSGGYESIGVAHVHVNFNGRKTAKGKKGRLSDSMLSNMTIKARSICVEAMKKKIGSKDGEYELSDIKLSTGVKGSKRYNDFSIIRHKGKSKAGCTTEPKKIPGEECVKQCLKKRGL